MFKLNILKFLSVSLLMCPMLSSAMEPRNNAVETMLLSISNQSEQIVEAFVSTIQAGRFLEDVTVQPYEDNDYVMRKNGRVKIYTQLGMFTLAPDNLEQPVSMVLSQNRAGHEGQILIVQEMPYHELNNVILIANPNGSVSFAQANVENAFERINAIQPDVAQVAIIPQARVAKCDLSTQTRQFLNSSHVEYYCKASIVFDQEPNQQFMNNFIEFLKQRLPKPINHGGTRNRIPVQITSSGTSIYIRAPLLLTREFLQCILDYANEHFANQ